MAKKRPIRALSPASSTSSSSSSFDHLNDDVHYNRPTQQGENEIVSGGEDDDESMQSLEDSEEDEFASDRATARQYVGESDLEDAALDDEEDEESEESDDDAKMRGVAGPSNLSFADQLKAQKKARRSQAQSASQQHASPHSDEDSDAGPTRQPSGRRGRAAPRHSLPLPTKTSLPKRPEKRGPLPHRSDKHAPMIQSSKRPVPRFRSVIEGTEGVWTSTKARDPRFDPLSGSVDEDLVKRSYGFLDAQRGQELKNMKELLGKATKGGKGKGSGGGRMGAEERKEVEDAVRRMENREVERKRKEREEEARRKWKKEEREARAQGKGAFYLKRKDEKKMLLEERFKDLSGDKRRLHKSMDRKRKKEAARGKKAMPPPRTLA